MSQQALLLLVAAGAVLTVIGLVVGPLMQLGLSRSRESLADASGAELTRNPAERTLLSARLFQTAPVDYEATPLTSPPGATQSSLRRSQRRRRT